MNFPLAPFQTAFFARACLLLLPPASCSCLSFTHRTAVNLHQDDYMSCLSSVELQLLLRQSEMSDIGDFMLISIRRRSPGLSLLSSCSHVAAYPSYSCRCFSWGRITPKEPRNQKPKPSVQALRNLSGTPSAIKQPTASAPVATKKATTTLFASKRYSSQATSLFSIKEVDQ